MIEFAEKYNILYRCQFGFRKNYSMSHTLIHLSSLLSTKAGCASYYKFKKKDTTKIVSSALM